MPECCDPSWAEWLGGVGGLLAGLAAVAAVVLGARGGPRALATWRRQRLAEQRAAVAGEAMSASLRLLRVLSSNISKVLWATELDEDWRAQYDNQEAQRRLWAEEIQTRWSLAADAIGRFQDALDRATGLLPEGARDALQAIDEALWDIQRLQIVAAQAGAAGGARLEGMDDKYTEDLDTLETEMLRALRPLVQLENL